MVIFVVVDANPNIRAAYRVSKSLQPVIPKPDRYPSETSSHGSIMSLYEAQSWQVPGRQTSWEQPAPPSRSGMFGGGYMYQEECV